jgi:hypothetical protein
MRSLLQNWSRKEKAILLPLYGLLFLLSMALFHAPTRNTRSGASATVPSKKEKSSATAKSTPAGLLPPAPFDPPQRDTDNAGGRVG